MSVAPRVFRSDWPLVVLAGWRVSAVLAVFVPGLAMATPVPVTVTITSVECTQNDECDAAGNRGGRASCRRTSTPRSSLTGSRRVTAREPDDRLKVEPTGLDGIGHGR